MATDVSKKRRTERTGFEPVHRPYRFTADQVLKMVEVGIIPEDKSTELLDGVLYQVTKGELHNVIVGELCDQLRPFCPAGYHVREEKSNRAGERSMPEPDAAVCRGTRKQYCPDLPPLESLALVVEVCHSSEKADRVTKFGIYGAAGVPCYWIVNVDSRSVAVWSDPISAKRKRARYQSVITCSLMQSIPVVIDGQPRGEIRVADIFPPEKQP